MFAQEGWDRRVVARGEAAKRTKRLINRERIVPPRSGRPDEILAAAAPEVQPPPAWQRQSEAPSEPVMGKGGRANPQAPEEQRQR